MLCYAPFYSSSFYCRVGSGIGAFPMRYLVIMYPAYLIYRDFDYWLFLPLVYSWFVLLLELQ